uniref:Uncharacterized protein n=1 Tax=Heterorhabditis bacteriophora TaxID=37862 RepID=A0A1I7WIQ9_HETBA
MKNQSKYFLCLFLFKNARERGTVLCHFSVSELFILYFNF